MPQAITVYLGAHTLDDDIDEVVLEILRDARYEGHSDGSSQQEADTFEELRSRILLIAGRVLVDHVAENKWIQQREDLIDSCQEECQYNQLPILFEIRE